MPYFLLSSLPWLLFFVVFILSIRSFINSYKSNKLSLETQKDVHEIKEEVKLIEDKIGEHISETLKQNKELSKKIEESVRRSKVHNENNIKGLEQFIKNITDIK